MPGQKTQAKAKSKRESDASEDEQVKQQADAEIWEDDNSQAQQRRIFAEAMARQDRLNDEAARGEDDRTLREDLPELQKARQRKVKELEDDRKENPAEGPLPEPYGTIELSEEYEAGRTPYPGAGADRCPNCGAALVLDETTGLLHI